MSTRDELYACPRCGCLTTGPYAEGVPLWAICYGCLDAERGHRARRVTRTAATNPASGALHRDQEPAGEEATP